MSQATDVKIANIALSHLGDYRITSLADNTEQARKVNAIYTLTRDSLLFDHPWSFAKKQATLAVNATAPTYEFDYAFDLPSDFIRLLSINEELPQTIKHEIVGSQIFISESTLDIKYVYRVTDPTKFSDGFVECLSLLLAAKLAYSITRSRGMREQLMGEFAAKLSQVAGINAQSRGSAQTARQDTWIRGRQT